MDAPTPPAIALEDLDRDALLQLITGRFRGYGNTVFTRYDLLSARWEVAIRRSRAARKAAEPVRSAYYAVLLQELPKGQRAMSAFLKDREAKRLAYESVERRVKRIENAERRAWAALQACPMGARL